MAMLIGKFHKLIQSKLLWGVFSILIIISFVFWGTYSSDQQVVDTITIDIT